MIAPKLKARLEAGETLLTAWLSLPAPLIAEALARDGWDAVVIDLQHGLASFDDMVEAVAGVHRCGAAPIVRVPLADEGLIGRALDAGAEAIISPMINSGQDAAWLAKTCKYPPLGQRSWAPFRAMEVLGFGKDEYLQQANGFTVTLPMIETRWALKNIDAIASTEGIDALFVGTNDLCVSLTEGAACDPTHAEVIKALEQVVRKCSAHGVVAGAYANTPEIARRYRELGFKLIAVGNDAGFLRAGSQTALAAARG